VKTFVFRKIPLWFWIVIFGGVFCGALAGAFMGLTRDLPQIQSLESYSPSAVTRIFSEDQQLLAELYLEKRDPVALAAIPKDLTAALIATEDRKFYRHSGVDLKAVLRAAVKDLMAGAFKEGASTITQQLAKTLFLTPRKTLVRKFKEAVLAFQLERRYTKDEILTLYLNQVYFGSGAYGVQSASRIFFGKSVQDLTLAECALIAGMPKSPSRYSPRIDPELAIRRRNVVLRQMLETGLISQSQYRTAMSEPLQLENAPPDKTRAPYFIDRVKGRLEDILGPDRLYKGGLTVHTTLVYPHQRRAEESLRSGLEALDIRMQANEPGAPPPQGSLVAIENATGGIVAMVGGRNYSESRFNRATDALRQPGSAFKPILYAYAVEKGFSQNKLILDAPVVFRGAREGQDWQPENFSEGFEGEITLRKALAKSKNIPAVRLMEMLGPASVATFAHSLGIAANLQPNLTLALGSSGISLMELTSAYSVFANRGRRIEPWSITEVADPEGRVIWRSRPRQELVMSRTGAAIVTDMLEAVIREGTGRKALQVKRPIAGKTGTTDDFKDALFVGFSPSLSVGVWVGRDDYGSLGDGETGAKAALPIWLDFVQASIAEKPFEFFDLPDETTMVYMDPDTGEAVPENSARAVPALFRKDHAPKRIH
jgi:penicillin-binding protein 1A